MTEATTVAEITNQKPATLLKSCRAQGHPSRQREVTEVLPQQQADRLYAQVARGSHHRADRDPCQHRRGRRDWKNEFFVLSDEQVTALGLNGHTVPLVSRSVQLKGSRLRKANWKSLSAAGDRVHLLHISPAQGQRLSRKLRAYITGGERKEFYKGYKVLDPKAVVHRACRLDSGWLCIPANLRFPAHGTECLGCHVDGHHPSTQKQGRGARTYHREQSVQEPFGLAQREMVEEPQGQGGLDGKIRVPPLPTP